ncbi:MAG: hypothetical protein CL680_05225 [Blastomonas sp.]|nr:hypothetical protein [Blastomonas sp.]
MLSLQLRQFVLFPGLAISRLDLGMNRVLLLHLQSRLWALCYLQVERLRLLSSEIINRCVDELRSMLERRLHHIRKLIITRKKVCAFSKPTQLACDRRQTSQFGLP